MTIKGKTIVVTGASSGIGYALAMALAKKGARLTLASRHKDILTDISHEITDTFPACPPPYVVETDVSQKADRENLVKKCIEEHGSINVL